MKTNNVIYNINRAKSKKINKKKISYECIFHCPTNINDCINSVDIFEDKIVFGTLMGNVYLCRVDEKKLNKNNEFQKIIKNENRKSSSTENIENDESNIKLNNNNSNSKYDCIKLTVHNNNDKNSSENNEDVDDNVRIFNKKNKNNNININLNNDNIENNNLTRKFNNYDNNENKNYTNEENDNDEDENSNKYEKKLINKNMGKISSQKNGNIQINNDSKIFNEKKDQNKKNKTKNKNIDFPQVTRLIFRFKENIPCLQFENSDIIYISLGDLEVITFQNMSTFNMNDESSTYNYSKLRNYKLENDHIQYCENSTCMIGNACFLIVFTEFANFNNELEIKDIKYENKNLKTFEIIKGTIKMSNYVVPFDFDGDKFLFLDYLSKEERIISVVYTASKNAQYNYMIKNRDYGHISHMKLLPNNKIFICRKNKECEIHLMNKDFNEIEKWVHIGEDVLSCYIFIKNKNILYDNTNNKENNKLSQNNKDSEEEENEESYENNDEKSEDGIKKNILKLLENKGVIKNGSKKELININQTINIATIQPNTEKTNKFNTKQNVKNLISSKGNENSYIHTENNQVIFSKKNLLKNNMDSLNPSFDNSSRREINFTDENKRFTSHKNSKTNSATKYNLLTSDKKKKNSKNTVSSIEIYGKKKKNGIKNKIKKINIINGSNYEGNEEDQTIINKKETENYSIFTLDKDGSVNIYNNKNQKNLFNLYNMSKIDNKYKNLEFFSVGFPYYIVANDFYYGITTDHGLFVISKIIE